MHDCIQCGCACYCHGDIDDCPVETIEYAYDHCVGCGCHEDPHEDFFDDEEPEPPTPRQVPEPVLAPTWKPKALNGKME